MKEQVGRFNLPVPRTFTGLRKKFDFVPYTILRAMDGEWQKKKAEWMQLGIKSEVGRGDNLGGFSEASNRQMVIGDAHRKVNHGRVFAIGDKDTWERSKQGKSLHSRTLTKEEKRREPGGGGGPNSKYIRSGAEGTGTSVFDPVLTEICYRWFCKEGGRILDPFAGGSVRGIVAHVLGYRYWGCELRPEQVAANKEQAEKIIPEDPPVWVRGDSTRELEHAPMSDFIFSCPPYGDLEVYSDLPEDLSNKSYREFRNAYREIIVKAVDRLKDHRFACFVVANFRDKRTGFYHDFVGDTVRCFQKAGLHYYNEAIFVTPGGSLPIRAGRQFESGRKLGKTHQNVLVFYKGNKLSPEDIFEEERDESQS